MSKEKTNNQEAIAELIRKESERRRSRLKNDRRSRFSLAGLVVSVGIVLASIGIGVTEQYFLHPEITRAYNKALISENYQQELEKVKQMKNFRSYDVIVRSTQGVAFAFMMGSLPFVLSYQRRVQKIREEDSEIEADFYRRLKELERSQ